MNKNLILISALTISMLLFSCGTSQNNKPAVAVESTEVIVTIDAKTFGELSSSQPGTILDVRTPEEWSEGTIKDAVKMNYHDDNFAEQVEGLDKTAPIYVYCKSGRRSSGAADILKEKGFAKVYNLDGGITSWRENGFEVVK